LFWQREEELGQLRRSRFDFGLKCAKKTRGKSLPTATDTANAMHLLDSRHAAGGSVGQFCLVITHSGIYAIFGLLGCSRQADAQHFLSACPSPSQLSIRERTAILHSSHTMRSFLKQPVRVTH
jgi:hypothetical protein